MNYDDFKEAKKLTDRIVVYKDLKKIVKNSGHTFSLKRPRGIDFLFDADHVRITCETVGYDDAEEFADMIAAFADEKIARLKEELKNL